MKLIFDLDQTLVNSRILKPLRQKRDWQSVYSLIPQCTLYPGISEVFDYIRINKIPVCIVSTAPRPYIERMIRHFNIPCNAIVGYYDAKPIKPHPAPMLKALELLGADASEAISFGDRQIDIESSNRAGIRSVACLWDSDEPFCSSMATNAISAPSQIINCINN